MQHLHITNTLFESQCEIGFLINLICHVRHLFVVALKHRKRLHPCSARLHVRYLASLRIQFRGAFVSTEWSLTSMPLITLTTTHIHSGEVCYQIAATAWSLLTDRIAPDGMWCSSVVIVVAWKEIVRVIYVSSRSWSRILHYFWT
jgi:hypothetical protein